MSCLTRSNFLNKVFYIGLSVFFMCSGQALMAISFPEAGINPPLVMDKSACEGMEIPPLTATGEQIRWYADEALTMLVCEDDTFYTGHTAYDQYIYYVTQTISGIESEAAVATLYIWPVPDAPETNDITVCFGNEVPDLYVWASNQLGKWYSDPELLNHINTGMYFTTGHTNPGLYTYYVTKVQEDACEGPASEINLIINPVPDKPEVSDSTFYLGSQNIKLYTDGDNIKWYKTYDRGFTDPRDNSYYLTTELGKHQWLARNLNYFTPKSKYYNNDSLEYESIYGRLYNWYEASDVCPDSWRLPDITDWDELISFLGGDSIAGGKMKVGYGSYWKLPNTGAKNSSLFSAFPAGRTSDGSYSEFLEHKESAFYWSSSAVSGEGRAYHLSYDTAGILKTWFNVSTGLSVRCLRELFHLASTENNYYPEFQYSGNYSFLVSQSNEYCESLCDTVILTILNVPEPASSDAYGCIGTEIPPLTANGKNIKWYSNNELTDLLHEGDTFYSGDTAKGTHTYFVNQTIDGVTGPARAVSLRIWNYPDSAVFNDYLVCEGDDRPVIFASNHEDNEYCKYLWYADKELSALIQKSEVLYTDTFGFGTYNFYVRPVLNEVCKGPVTQVKFVYNPVPSPLSLKDTTVCSDESEFLLTTDGNQVLWYQDHTQTMTDKRDDQVYQVKRIGNQLWMTENLNYYEGYVPVYFDETGIRTISQYYNDDSLSYSASYGRLYTWNNAINVCPEGWHLPDLEEWQILIDYLGGDSLAGGKLKSNNDTLWNEPNVQASNESSFSALPGGAYKVYEGSLFIDVRDKAYFWTSNTVGKEMVGAKVLSYESGEITEEKMDYYDDRVSIRCLSDDLVELYDTGSSLLINYDSADTMVYYATQTVDGCESILDTVTILIGEVPEINIGHDTTIRDNDTLTINIDDIYNSYLWSNGHTGNSFLFRGNEYGEGNHWLFLTVWNNAGCSASDSIQVAVTKFTDLTDPLSDQFLQVWPNPNNGIFNIGIDQKNQKTIDLKLVLLNELGQRVYASELIIDGGNPILIKLPHLNSGIYFLKVRTKGPEVYTQKIIIHKDLLH